MNAPVIELSDICKTFPGNIKANQNCALTVREGEVHAVVGENGAGKTTLMNILYGLYHPDSGEIKIRGRIQHIDNPRLAKSLGIQMVHQHFMLVPSFTVLQNIVLGFEPRRGIFVDVRESVREIRKICDQYNLSVPLNEKLKDLPVGVQQRVEIVKAIYRKADILILDEPTAVLTPQEVDELFLICEEMKKANKTILFISHKLKEVMRISDRITVMRRGRTIATIEKRETSEKALASLIIGEEKKVTLAEHILKEDFRGIRADSEQRDSPVVLELRDVNVKDRRGHQAVKNLSLQVHAGEIVGVAGVEGNGQSELVEAITGILPIESGKISFKGNPIKRNSIQKRRSAGMRHIPEDRMHTGLCIAANICENFIVDQEDRRRFLNSWNIINWKNARSYSETLIHDYNVTAPNSDTLVNTLSGGNMQKVVAARELASNHDCLLVAHPTRGIDIGSADFIYRKIMEAKHKDVAILLISADLDELFLLSDRLAVIYEGEIVGEFLSGTISAQEIGMYMTGARRETG